jgi:hypothetical protein
MTKVSNRGSSVMSSQRAVLLGMLVLAACAGCGTATRTVAAPTSSDAGAAVQASPETVTDAGQTCEQYGGWYDAVAGACDSNGE